MIGSRRTAQWRSVRGFTLIELLVVIAIIAILAAILFPVFAQAREKARAIACMSNLKQLGLAMMQYAQDYDEHYPDGWHPDGGDGSQTGMTMWRISLLQYMGMHNYCQRNSDLYGPLDQRNWTLNSIISCPDDPASLQYGPSSYGYNTSIFTNGWNDNLGGGSPQQYNGQPLAAIIQPAHDVAFCDAGTVWQLSHTIDPYYSDGIANTAAECKNYQSNDGANGTGVCGPFRFAPEIWKSVSSVDWSVGVPGMASDWGANGDRRPFALHGQHINGVFGDGHAKAVPARSLNLKLGTTDDIWHDHN